MKQKDWIKNSIYNSIVNVQTPRNKSNNKWIIKNVTVRNLIRPKNWGIYHVKCLEIIIMYIHPYFSKLICVFNNFPMEIPN